MYPQTFLVYNIGILLKYTEMTLVQAESKPTFNLKAVEAGVSVELVRSARHHGGDGNWGDLLIPVVLTQHANG